MLQQLIVISVQVIIFLCLAVIVFAPSIFAVWFFLVGKRLSQGRKKKSLRPVISVVAINLMVAYALYHLTFDYIVVARTAQKDALARQAVESVIESELRYYKSHGRYYALGPVRGPYEDRHGASVAEDVILQVTPHWSEAASRNSFKAAAVHVWGSRIITGDAEGRVRELDPETKEAEEIRGKLLRSVR